MSFNPKKLDSAKVCIPDPISPSTGISPSLSLFSNKLLRDGHFLHTSLDYNSLSYNSDFQFGLLAVQSPLLSQSLLISFPPLNDMLKLGGLSCLSQVVIVKEVCSGASQPYLPKSSASGWLLRQRRPQAPLVSWENRNSITLRLEVLLTLKHTWSDCYVGPPNAFENQMTRVLQFALLIAVRCVLPRYENLDIHRWKFSFFLF